MISDGWDDDDGDDDSMLMNDDIAGSTTANDHNNIAGTTGTGTGTSGSRFALAVQDGWDDDNDGVVDVGNDDEDVLEDGWGDEDDEIDIDIDDVEGDASPAVNAGVDNVGSRSNDDDEQQQNLMVQDGWGDDDDVDIDVGVGGNTSSVIVDVTDKDKNKNNNFFDSNNDQEDVGGWDDDDDILDEINNYDDIPASTTNTKNSNDIMENNNNNSLNIDVKQLGFTKNDQIDDQVGIVDDGWDNDDDIDIDADTDADTDGIHLQGPPQQVSPTRAGQNTHHQNTSSMTSRNIINNETNIKNKEKETDDADDDGWGDDDLLFDDDDEVDVDVKQQHHQQPQVAVANDTTVKDPKLHKIYNALCQYVESLGVAGSSNDDNRMIKSMNTLLEFETNTIEHSYELLSYYEERPQLFDYTIEKELSRLRYQIIDDTNNVLLDSQNGPEEQEQIKQLFLSHASSPSSNGDIGLLIRCCNQSILADGINVITDHDERFVQLQYMVSCVASECTFQFNMSKRFINVQAILDIKLPTIATGSSNQEPFIMIGQCQLNVMFAPFDEPYPQIRYYLDNFSNHLKKDSINDHSYQSQLWSVAKFLVDIWNDDEDDEFGFGARHHHEHNNITNQLRDDWFQKATQISLNNILEQQHVVGFQSALKQMDSVANISGKLNLVKNSVSVFSINKTKEGNANKVYNPVTGLLEDAAEVEEQMQITQTPALGTQHKRSQQPPPLPPPRRPAPPPQQQQQQPGLTLYRKEEEPTQAQQPSLQLYRKEQPPPPPVQQQAQPSLQLYRKERPPPPPRQQQQQLQPHAPPHPPSHPPQQQSMPPPPRPQPPLPKPPGSGNRPTSILGSFVKSLAKSVTLPDEDPTMYDSYYHQNNQNQHPHAPAMARDPHPPTTQHPQPVEPPSQPPNSGLSLYRKEETKTQQPMQQPSLQLYRKEARQVEQQQQPPLPLSSQQQPSLQLYRKEGTHQVQQQRPPPPSQQQQPSLQLYRKEVAHPEQQQKPKQQPPSSHLHNEKGLTQQQPPRPTNAPIIEPETTEIAEEIIEDGWDDGIDMSSDEDDNNIESNRGNDIIIKKSKNDNEDIDSSSSTSTSELEMTAEQKRTKQKPVVLDGWGKDDDSSEDEQENAIINEKTNNLATQQLGTTNNGKVNEYDDNDDDISRKSSSSSEEEDSTTTNNVAIKSYQAIKIRDENEDDDEEWDYNAQDDIIETRKRWINPYPGNRNILGSVN